MHRAVSAVVLFCSLHVRAQREVPAPNFVPPAPNDAVIAGDKLSRNVTCIDSIHVYVQGQRNEVQVHGQCALVRIQGNRNFVWIDREAQVAVEGNDNMVYIHSSTTRVSSRGNGNRFELRR